jgi:hypothetical protein
VDLCWAERRGPDLCFSNCDDTLDLLVHVVYDVTASAAGCGAFALGVYGYTLPYSCQNDTCASCSGCPAPVQQ